MVTGVGAGKADITISVTAYGKTVSSLVSITITDAFSRFFVKDLGLGISIKNAINVKKVKNSKDYTSLKMISLKSKNS